MKQIYSARDEIDAHLARDFLATADVEAVIQGAVLANVIGEIPVSPSTQPSVWVRDEDYDRGMAAIDQFKSPRPNTSPPWKCPGCGEAIEPQFTECWNCGATAPQ